MSETTPTVDQPTACRAGEAEEARLRESMLTAPASLGALFLDRVTATPDREAFRAPDGQGGWVSYTWRQTAQVVVEIAAGLLALGIKLQDRVAIASATRLEWVHADLAIMCAGGATTTVYPTTPADDVEHILRDSGSRVAFAEDAEQLAKISDHLAALPNLQQVILIDDPGDARPPAGVPVMSLDALRERGRAHLLAHPDAVTERVAVVRADHLATLIYTSGTTGRPKGVRLPHGNWVYTGLATRAIGHLGAEDLGYLWLPLSHSFGKVLMATQIAVGHATAVDGRIDEIAAGLAAIHPTGMAGPPRIYEKAYARVVGMVESEGGAKARVFRWAFGVGRRVSALRQDGREPAGALALQHRAADRLVFAKIRDRFGGRVRNFISGAAPLNRDVAEWFDAAGLCILEGYGLTETSAASFVNRPGRYRLGTVGVPVPGTEVRLDDDGEILIKGPGVMEGYHGMPEETAAVLSADGWLRTGDIGEITPDGFLRITDRKKDLIKTAGGKYVAPGQIETMFASICPLGRIVVHGDGRSYVTALIALDADALADWAAAHGLADRPHAAIAASPELHQALTEYVDQLNARLPRWETIKRFAVLDHELTVEDGSLTPSLKLKRRVVEARHAADLDALYRD